MAQFENLESIIEDSVNDIREDTPADDLGEVETSTDDLGEASSQVPTPAGAGEDEPVAAEGDDPAATEVAAKPAVAAEDPFAKKHGIPARGVSGNENRIPYSRVKKIVTKAETDARAAATAEFQPKITEYETKLQGYEAERQEVQQFSHVLNNEPKEFIQMLAKHPAYKGFFDYLNENLPKGPGQPGGAPATPGSGDDPMPKPNQQLSDGSRVYDEEGLAKLMEWNTRQTEAGVIKKVEERYKPIEDSWKAKQQEEALRPVIAKQIAQARKNWPKFDENEAEITQALDANPSWDLNDAARFVLLPKLQAPQVDEAKLKADARAAAIAEMKQRGQSTGVSGSATSPRAAVNTAPRSLTDVITEQVEKLKR